MLQLFFRRGRHRPAKHGPARSRTDMDGMVQRRRRHSNLYGRFSQRLPLLWHRRARSRLVGALLGRLPDLAFRRRNRRARQRLYRYFIRNDQRILWRLGRCHHAALSGNRQFHSDACHFDAPAACHEAGIVHDHRRPDPHRVDWYGANHPGASAKNQGARIYPRFQNAGSQRVLYYFQKRAAKYFRANYHHGDVLDPERDFLRGVSRHGRPWHSSAASLAWIAH